MKAEELMIGDWITDGKHNYRVLQITNGEVYNWIKPIPLTKEILKKNGFVYNDLPFIHAWERDGLSIYGHYKHYHINCGQNISIDVSNVHQLQQALRFCRIDKDIVL